MLSPCYCRILAALQIFCFRRIQGRAVHSAELNAPQSAIR